MRTPVHPDLVMRDTHQHQSSNVKGAVREHSVRINRVSSHQDSHLCSLEILCHHRLVLGILGSLAVLLMTHCQIQRRLSAGAGADWGRCQWGS